MDGSITRAEHEEFRRRLEEETRRYFHRLYRAAAWLEVRKRGTYMNWKIRLKNPVFWVQVLTGALATVLAYSGLTAADMTTWAGLWNVITGAFSNPYCLFLVASR